MSTVVFLIKLLFLNKYRDRTMERFKGRRILVTGAGSGIGQATVARLLAEGGTVIAADISEAGLKKTTEQAENNGNAERLLTLTIDLAEEQQVQEKIGNIIAQVGGLEVLVNAAGILRGAHFLETSLELWNTLIKVNLTSTFLVTRQALPALLKSGKGVVVNFSSTSASFAHPYFAAYAATKGGIQSFTHAIASEYASQGLRAVAVVPGGIASGMTNTSPLPEGADLSLYAKHTPAIPGGYGSPDSVAGAIAMLASDDGEFITGTELRIDGGAHM
ncbi:SDR family oxidoreductase [Acinetobacter sp. IK40]|uniref:SDR family NAD(P)-dependent oxidoreductase n=1 Tax=Acinetobacter sp. IK40 TaxID=2928897 RepID=UPI002D1E5529|nr:SDR family oxidoreductase [Acinetobacter sp. IK40]MEB3792312.1 SDR family oxidoreductase [Acinetobacter sp. IK40]